MFGSAIIVFREVLEATLLIGIIAAATKGIPSRNRWIMTGIGAGLIGSVLVAAFTESIGEFASGMGQELLNAGILSIAVLMLAWHNIWMSSHGKELAMQAKQVGSSIKDGTSEISVLMTVIGLAVLREGSETVLFLYGIASTTKGGATSLLLGGLLGAAGGILVGVGIYAGLLKVPLRWFFSATSGLVLLLAAGMASQAARFLIQADLLPSLASPAWDTSWLIQDSSLAGVILRSLIGYEARPATTQVICYVVTITMIWLGMRMASKQQSR